MSNDNYLEAHQNLRNVAKHCGGNLTKHDSLTEHFLQKKGRSTPSNNELAAAVKEAKDTYEAMVFLCSLNKERYQDLLDQLVNAYLSGRGEYPKTLISAYNLVTNWRGGNQQPCVKPNNGVAFNTVKEEDDKTNQDNGIVRSKAGKIVKCFICNGNHF